MIFPGIQKHRDVGARVLGRPAHEWISVGSQSCKQRLDKVEVESAMKPREVPDAGRYHRAHMGMGMADQAETSPFDPGTIWFVECGGDEGRGDVRDDGTDEAAFNICARPWFWRFVLSVDRFGSRQRSSLDNAIPFNCRRPSKRRAVPRPLLHLKEANCDGYPNNRA